MSSIIFIVCSLLFIGSFSVVISEKTENIVEAAIVSTAYLFCVVGIIGAIYEVLHIPVYLPTICVGLGIIDFIFIITIFRKRKTNFIIPKMNKKDVRYFISVCVLIGFVFSMCLYHFGMKLKLTYGDVDAVHYFTMAMDIVKTHTVSDEFVTPLWISIFIQLIQPIQPEVFLYRGMILGNICMQILAAVFFFVLANKVNKQRNVINTIITILFWCGYQLYILTYGTFLHWEDGILLLMFIIYHIMAIWEKRDNFKYGVIGCLAGTIALALCYPFFGIILIALVVPEVVVWGVKDENKKKVTAGEKYIILILAVIGALIGIVFMKERIPNLVYLLYNFSSEGLAYKEPYMDFIFFVPMVGIYLVFMIQKRDEKSMPRSIFRMNISALVFMVFWIVFYEMGYLSNYYLYRNYYVIWMLAWLVVAQTVSILIQKKQVLLIVTYATLYGLCMVISVTRLDEIIYSYNSELYLDNPAGRTMAPLYSFNLNNLAKDTRSIISSDAYNVYQYRMENLNNKWVPMISSQWTILDVQWYEAICRLAEGNGNINIENTSFVENIESLANTETDYVLIDKLDPILHNYVSMMNEYWNIEVETDELTIYRKPVEGWLNIIDSFEKLSKESVEFEKYIRDNYGYNNVMLLCESMYSGKADINEYRAYVGEHTLRYLGQFEPETFIKCTYVLNNDDVYYVAIYKDSEIYLQNRQYFDSQKLLYENDIAMIITYNGEGWMPNQ